VVVEAQASGLPVVVSDRGAAHENMRDGVTGMVVDHRDAHKLSWTLQRLLEDSELRRRMSGEAHEFSQRYSMTDALRGTFREYTKILYGNNAPEQEAPAAPPTLREVRDHQ
ncbi:MAG: glycosyltransferase, partial [Myxococcota bacterium]